MSLDTRVFGDPASCYACADPLAALAPGVNDRLRSARDGRVESEYEFGSHIEEFTTPAVPALAGSTAVVRPAIPPGGFRDAS